MDAQQIIGKFFKNETTAMSYIQSRLLENFEEAPPATSDRFIEEFPTDFLQHLVDHLKDKTIFWNACFQLFKKWRCPQKADKKRARSLRELVYMIRRFDYYHKEMFVQEKERWQAELDAHNLGETPYTEQEKNVVYVQNLSLVHIWDLWPDDRWEKLYENIVRERSVSNEAQFELMLIVTQHLKWDAVKTMQLFQWTLDGRDMPTTFFNQYFFHRLCLCGNSKTYTNTEEQKKCQNKLIGDIIKAQDQLIYTLLNEEKATLGKALLEASELFELKSFQCLNERRRTLLNRELVKLTQPPSEGETSMLKSGIARPSEKGYMDAHYAKDAHEELVA